MTDVSADGQPVAVVTAAAGAGVGGGVARALADAGYRVFASDFHAGRAEKMGADPRFDVSVVDVADPSALEGWITSVIAREERLDVVVSCAGTNHVGPIWEMTVEQWRHVLDVNLNSHFVAARAALPAMLARGHGVLLAIASVAAWRPTKRE